MKSILDNLTIKQIESSLLPVTLTVTGPQLVELDSMPSFHGLDVSREYESRLVLSHRFRSTAKNCSIASDQSRKIIATHLYADVIRVVDDIVSATFAGDAEAILSLCSALRKDLTNIGS